MIQALKILAAVAVTLFLVALGAFGGCLAGVMSANDLGSSLGLFGLIGGGIAGLWLGIVIARKIVADPKRPNDVRPVQTPRQDPNEPF